MSAEPTLKRYLSVRQICERLPVCKSLVYRLVRDGEIPSARLGGKILVREDDLVAMLERRQSRKEPPPRPAPPRTGDGFVAYYQKIMDEVARKHRR
jgi:excisionase family DNA binding protein